MSLALLRLGLACVVLDGHLGLLWGAVQAAYLQWGLRPDLAPGPAVIAVQGFFLISGYVIAAVWRRGEGTWRFYAARLARIYPLYWLVLGLELAGRAWAGQAAHYDAWGWLSNLLLWPQAVAATLWPQSQGGLSMGYALLNAPAWTLAYDLLFYLSVPLLLRRGVLVGVLLVCGAVWLALAATPARFVPLWQQYVHFSLWPALWAFCAGAWVQGAGAAGGRLARWWPAGAVLALVAGYGPGPGGNAVLIQLAGTVGLLPLVASLGLRRAPGDALTGHFTYSLYLVQWPVLALLAAGGWTLGKWAEALVMVALAAGLTLVFEVPLERWRHRVFGGPRRDSPGMRRQRAGNQVAPWVGSAGAVVAIVALAIPLLRILQHDVHERAGLPVCINASQLWVRSAQASQSLRMRVGGAPLLRATRQPGGWLLRIAGRPETHVPVRAGDMWWSLDRSVPGVMLLFVAGRGFALPAATGAVCVDDAGGESRTLARAWWTMGALP